jgi:hypothetical protein
LLKRLGVRPDLELPDPMNRLGDWYANVLNIGPHRLVMSTSERTLLTVIVPIRDSARLRERIRERAHEILLQFQIPPSLVADEVRGMDRMAIGKATNRSILGSMNEFAFLAKHYFAREREGTDLAQLQLYLARTPCGALKYSFPCEEVRRAFGLAQLHSV